MEKLTKIVFEFAMFMFFIWFFLFPLLELLFDRAGKNAGFIFIVSLIVTIFLYNIYKLNDNKK